MVTALDEKASASFRQHLPDLSSPRFTTAKEQDAYSYADAFNSKQNPPWLYNLTSAWQRLYTEPYKGVTTDGKNPSRAATFSLVLMLVPQETSYRICFRFRMKESQSIALSTL